MLVCIRMRALLSELLLCVCATYTAWVPEMACRFQSQCWEFSTLAFRGMQKVWNEHCKSWRLGSEWFILSRVVYPYPCRAFFLWKKSGSKDENRIVLAHLADILHLEDPEGFPLHSYIALFFLFRAVLWFWMERSMLQEASWAARGQRWATWRLSTPAPMPGHCSRACHAHSSGTAVWSSRSTSKAADVGAQKYRRLLPPLHTPSFCAPSPHTLTAPGLPVLTLKCEISPLALLPPFSFSLIPYHHHHLSPAHNHMEYTVETLYYRRHSDSTRCLRHIMYATSVGIEALEWQ